MYQTKENKSITFNFLQRQQQRQNTYQMAHHQVSYYFVYAVGQSSIDSLLKLVEDKLRICRSDVFDDLPTLAHNADYKECMLGDSHSDVAIFAVTANSSTTKYAIIGKVNVYISQGYWCLDGVRVALPYRGYGVFSQLVDHASLFASCSPDKRINYIRVARAAPITSQDKSDGVTEEYLTEQYESLDFDRDSAGGLIRLLVKNGMPSRRTATRHVVVERNVL